MRFMRSARCFLLALAVFGPIAQQQLIAQIAPGTTRTGTFIWDGQRWLPVESPAPPSPVVAGVEITVDIAPPPLPVYVQPPCPAPNLLWTPGYWHHGFLGYYWVPGAWVPAPYTGALWTPPYWGFAGGSFGFHIGYWGPHIGFYGGVDYGFGYGGVGYEGGRWVNGVFAYNRTVNNFGSVTITNVYEKTVIVDPGGARVSFNGGSGGTAVRPTTPEEEAAAHEQHVAAIPAQLQHERTASANTALLASENHGHPAIAATSKPGEFTGKGVVAAREVTPSHTLPSVKPAGAAAIDKNPASPSPQAVKPNPSPGLAKLPNTKPDGAVEPGADHAGSRTLDKKEPANDQAKQNTGSLPKSSTIEAKPLATTPPSQAVKPNPPPQPAPAAAIKPSPPPPPAKPAVAASAKTPPPPPPLRPSVKPACPPGKTMTPSGCK